MFIAFENKLFSVFKRCIFQRSRGRGPKNFLGQVADLLFCCAAVAIKKVSNASFSIFTGLSLKCQAKSYTSTSEKC